MKTVTFHDIQATTPDPEAIAARDTATSRPPTTAAPDAEARRAVLDDWDRLRREIDTWISLVGLRFQQDTAGRGAQGRRSRSATRLSPKFAELDNALHEASCARQRACGGDRRGASATHLLDVWECEHRQLRPGHRGGDGCRVQGRAPAYTELVSSASVRVPRARRSTSRSSYKYTHARQTARCATTRCEAALGLVPARTVRQARPPSTTSS